MEIFKEPCTLVQSSDACPQGHGSIIRCLTVGLEEFTEPVYDQVHQEQIAASEMTENIAEIPIVQEQVIVGTRAERLVDARGPLGGGWSVRHARALKLPSPLLSRRHGAGGCT